MYKETVVVAFHKPSSGRRRKTIHSISNSIAYRPWRGYNILINTEDVNEKEENNVYSLFNISYYNYMHYSGYK